ncbi:hypothetical protein CVE39_15780 [Enterobacter cloacae complex sp.]|nr:hypothetical protein CVE39_15780 [Enterobacter cloacae complex sp.]
MAAARFTKCPGWVLTKTKPLYVLSPTGDGFVQQKFSGHFHWRNDEPPRIYREERKGAAD